MSCWYISKSNGATGCIDSTAGSYIGVTGATGPAQMQTCPAGTYSEAGASECTPFQQVPIILQKDYRCITM